MREIVLDRSQADLTAPRALKRIGAVSKHADAIALDLEMEALHELNDLIERSPYIEVLLDKQISFYERTLRRRLHMQGYLLALIALMTGFVVAILLR
jgi:hypothetical protein